MKSDAFCQPHRPARPRLSLISFVALARQRRALARLDERRLRDLGLCLKDAEAEARRPFWDVPDTWRR